MLGNAANGRLVLARRVKRSGSGATANICTMPVSLIVLTKAGLELSIPVYYAKKREKALGSPGPGSPPAKEIIPGTPWVTFRICRIKECFMEAVGLEYNSDRVWVMSASLVI